MTFQEHADAANPVAGRPFAERMRAALADALDGRPVDGHGAFVRSATLFGADVALVLEKRTRGELRALGVAFRVIVEDEPMQRESDRLMAIAMRAFGVTRGDIKSHRRTRRVVMARHFVAHWLFRRTTMSSTMIGRRLGGRDHTTALHARDTWPRKRKLARAIRAAIRTGIPLTSEERATRLSRARRLIPAAGCGEAGSHG